jgi:hypothetical protein
VDAALVEHRRSWVRDSSEYDDLGDGAPAQRHNWDAAGHRLDHDQAERFFPADREEQTGGLLRRRETDETFRCAALIRWRGRVR